MLLLRIFLGLGQAVEKGDENIAGVGGPVQNKKSVSYLCHLNIGLMILKDPKLGL